MKAWWRAFLAPAPDPRKPLTDAVARQRTLLGRVRQARGDIASARRRVEARIVPMLGVLEGLESRAREMVAAGRDDLARGVLERRWSMARELRGLEEQAGELAREEAQLALLEERLSTRIEAFDARQQALFARTTAADAHARIAEELVALAAEGADVGPTVAEAERRAEASQARAAAIERLAETGALDTPGATGDIEAALANLDRDRAIDVRLEELRRRTSDVNERDRETRR